MAPNVPSLLELQRRFAAGLGGEAHALDGLVAEHGLRAAQRLQIYRNNFNISLSGCPGGGLSGCSAARWRGIFRLFGP